MSWILFSILPPLLWAVTNYVDKYLIEKHFKKSHGATLMLLVVSTGLILLPFVYFFSNANFSLSAIHILIIFGSSLLSIISWILYARALSGDNVSVVVPLFQLMPLFSYILGLIFLDEHLGIIQIIGSLIIIFGSILISLELSEKKIKLKKGVILPMIATTILSSVNVLIIKYLMIENSFWSINFWNYFFLGLIGITLLLTVKSWREEISTAFKSDLIGVGGISFSNELLDFGATMLYRYAMLLAPMALVSVLSNGFQPVFTLILGVSLSLVLPKFTHEKFSKVDLIQRTIAILIIFAGTFLINK